MFDILDYRFNPAAPDRDATTISTYHDLEDAKEHACLIAENCGKSGGEMVHIIMILDTEARKVVFKTAPIYPSIITDS